MVNLTEQLLMKRIGANIIVGILAGVGNAVLLPDAPIFEFVAGIILGLFWSLPEIQSLHEKRKTHV